MPKALIALGSNLGDRAAHLRTALAKLSRLPHTRLLARSAWDETPPIGGPGAQGPFLNGAVLASTSLEPRALLDELQRIESEVGRVRSERWAARTLDLDLLLVDGLELHFDRLELPHPRMHYRHFVLRPAAEVAPWMVHPESGLTLAALLDHIDRGPLEARVAAADGPMARELVERLRAVTASQGHDIAIQEYASGDETRFRGLILAVAPTGSDRRQLRRILHLPAVGPIIWLDEAGVEPMASDAWAALASAWPELTPSPGDA
jgi:2-amino-4-hydroxy-6-hydroxymethyldihydropteridine diphosphokinase